MPGERAPSLKPNFMIGGGDNETTNIVNNK